MLLQYLQSHGSITGLEAFQKLGIMSYTKRIAELRNAGVLIASTYITQKSKFGVKRFVRYDYGGMLEELVKESKKEIAKEHKAKEKKASKKSVKKPLKNKGKAKKRK